MLNLKQFTSHKKQFYLHDVKLQDVVSGLQCNAKELQEENFKYLEDASNEKLKIYKLGSSIM